MLKKAYPLLFALISPALFAQAIPSNKASRGQQATPANQAAVVKEETSLGLKQLDTSAIDTTGPSIEFKFKYQKGDRYAILSTVEEDVFVNMRYDHHGEIVNRVSAEVTAADQATGSGSHECTFMTTENAFGLGGGKTFSWGEEYKSIFERTSLGRYTISDEYFMPTVRDVPIFPDHAIKPGDTWVQEGHEAHDLRKNFGLEKPYIVPFTATYKYLGTVGREKREVKQMSYAAASISKQRNNQVIKKEGNALHVFHVKYSLYTQAPQRPSANYYGDYPQTTMGFSDELIYWDAEKGAIDHYVENFRILIETAYGNIYEFRGTAHAEVTDFIRTGTDDELRAVEEQIKDLGIENVTVKKSDKGLTLSMENIQFKAESSQLMPSETEKIKKLAQILEAYPDNDILVSGHTATGKGRDPQELSEARAKAVADYLIQLGVKDNYHIFTQGFGDKKPIAPNNTEEGKAKNRRVEITIMDK